jgi:preprotein translocase subunit SecG
MMGMIRYHTGRFDMLAGVLFLALAMVLANLYSRKRNATRNWPLWG